MSIDLELSDFISSSPCLTTRTPGQLLSLTSHLTFGSGESKTRITSNFMNALNRQSKFIQLFIFILISFFERNLKLDFVILESPDCDLDSSLHKNNDSHVSGISPFFSSEDINVSINLQPNNDSVSKKFLI